MKSKQIKAPGVIFLQRPLFDPEEDHETSWCEDPIDSSDVKYIRADLVEQRAKRWRVRFSRLWTRCLSFERSLSQKSD